MVGKGTLIAPHWGTLSFSWRPTDTPTFTLKFKFSTLCIPWCIWVQCSTWSSLTCRWRSLNWSRKLTAVLIVTFMFRSKLRWMWRLKRRDQVDMRIQHLQLPNFLLEADSDSSSDLEHESYKPKWASWSLFSVQCTCIFLICSWRSFSCSCRVAATPTLTLKRTNSRIRAIQGYLQPQHSVAQLFHEALQVGHLSSIQIIWGIGRPLTSCSTFLCLFVTQPPMFSWTIIKCQVKCISCKFGRCISC